MDPTTARFVSSATALPAAAPAVLYEAFLERWPHGGREGSRVARVSASEHSAIDHAVRSALLPRAVELEQARKSFTRTASTPASSPRGPCASVWN